MQSMKKRNWKLTVLSIMQIRRDCVAFIKDARFAQLQPFDCHLKFFKAFIMAGSTFLSTPCIYVQ